MSKLLLVASFASSLIRFRGDLVRALRAAGHTVVAAAPDPDEATVRALAEMDVRCIATPLARAGMNPFADISYLINLRRVIKAERPKVVLAYTPKPVIYSGLATRGIKGVRHCALISGLGYGFGRETLRQRVLTPLLSTLFAHGVARSSSVVFQNRDDRDLFLARRIVKPDQAALVNGSGVDTGRFAVAPLPCSPSFLLMARLIPEKGVREYIQAARLVRARIPDARFLLAGWIEERAGAITAAEVQQWSDEGVVEYLGSLDDVRPAIAQASVYVLPTYYREGVPRSVLEAMSMGRAIITTDAPGCRETVVDGVSGFLVAPREPEPLARRMEQLARDAATVARMGSESRRLVEERFAVERVNADMLRIMGMNA
ncbi:MAG: glycosyltransferase family 4 protein [Steroidobacter sp.]